MPEYRKKLIEVALPLEAINKESAREKSIRHGHPSTLHLWWARRPLATCRAVLFAHDEFPTEEAQAVERQRLFRIIEELVKWGNITNEAVLHKARVEIVRSAARNHGISLLHSMTPAEVVDALKRYAPPVLDPFAGGGSIPLEAQRLGLEAHASDLNPVAVLINKAMIEIPPKFAGRPPVNPESRKKYLHKEWKGTEGLAEDIRYYGNWMRDEAWKRIGHLYPKVQLPKEQGSGEATVIAWIWAHTVTCPNPACSAQMPLVRSFALSTKREKEAWIKPIVDGVTKMVRFEVRLGTGAPESTVNRLGAKCIVCGSSVSLEHIRAEGKAGRMGTQLMAIVAEGRGGRAYLPPLAGHNYSAEQNVPNDVPDTELPQRALGFSIQNYGPTRHRDLFTPRQLMALITFSNLVNEVQERVLADSDGNISYANAVTTYLALAVDRVVDRHSTICTWDSSPSKLQLRNTFARQAIPMSWDFAEGNPFCMSSGTWTPSVEWVAKVVDVLPAERLGDSKQLDATASLNGVTHPIISTDPPYYDNVGYADLSDFFYIWLRRSLKKIYPSLFSTLLVPKGQELIADPFRHGSRERAQRFFEEGLGTSFARMREIQNTDYPLTVYYAFKQAESEDDSTDHGNGKVSASTGWETMLEGLLKADFSITGTWPMRTELGNRPRGLGSNALASSIVLVYALKRELPKALRDLQRGNIAPVDLAQATIGPGMAVFSRYSKILESDGTPMRVRTALQLINQMLDEVLAEQEGEYDADTRWAVAWFEQYGMEEGPYGVAETLSKAKNNAISTLVEMGFLQAKSGKVRLLHRNELSSNWNPATARRLTVWEVTQRLIRALQEQGDAGAAAILAHVGAYGEIARDLAYRLYTVCERKKWADEALAYNSLVVEWSDISGAAERLGRTTAEQARLFS